MTGVTHAPRQPLTRVGPVMIRLDDLQELKDLAEQDDSSLNREIRRAISVYLDLRRRRQAAREAPHT